MKIGLPKALLYYRYDVLWESFFEGLGCEVVCSGATTRDIMSAGVGVSVDECCLPVKVFLGHVASLIGRCDYILAPRFERFSKNGEYCVRFWGLPDIVRNTFPNAPTLTYDHQGQKACNALAGFLRMGQKLGKGPAETLRAYRSAQRAQAEADARLVEAQNRALADNGVKVLLAAQPYVVHDALMGGPLVRMIREQGAVPVFADHCARDACRACSKTLSSDLYWTMNREIIGSIPLLGGQVDGVMLVSAFPCGTDSLVNELVLRRIHALPVTSIVLDEQQGEAGLETRVECFIDILTKRRRTHAF